jgi:hypothetical protein
MGLAVEQPLPTLKRPCEEWVAPAAKKVKHYEVATTLKYAEFSDDDDDDVDDVATVVHEDDVAARVLEVDAALDSVNAALDAAAAEADAAVALADAEAAAEAAAEDVVAEGVALADALAELAARPAEDEAHAYLNAGQCRKLLPVRDCDKSKPAMDLYTVSSALWLGRFGEESHFIKRADKCDAKCARHAHFDVGRYEKKRVVPSSMRMNYTAIGRSAVSYVAGIKSTLKIKCGCRGKGGCTSPPLRPYGTILKAVEERAMCRRRRATVRTRDLLVDELLELVSKSALHANWYLGLGGRSDAGKLVGECIRKPFHYVLSPYDVK